MEFVSTAEGKFKGLLVKDNVSGQEKVLEADGAFIFVGVLPNTKFLSKTIDLNDPGFVKTQPGSVETSREGIFAAGDCRMGAIAQVAAATGEGVVASFAVKAFLKKEEV
jgi:thioredoxin reductase (NADPH)